MLCTLDLLQFHLTLLHMFNNFEQGARGTGVCRLVSFPETSLLYLHIFWHNGGCLSRRTERGHLFLQSLKYLSNNFTILVKGLDDFCTHP